MRYTWNEAKRTANLAKHGIDFAVAERFEWTVALVVQDIRRDYGEQRFTAVSFLSNRLHVMVFARRADNIRLISLRKANRREVKLYARSF